MALVNPMLMRVWISQRIFPTMHPEPGLELESETIALMELLDKSNTISLLSLHTGGHGWYTPDLTKDSTGVMTDLIDDLRQIWYRYWRGLT